METEGTKHLPVNSGKHHTAPFDQNFNRLAKDIIQDDDSPEIPQEVLKRFDDEDARIGKYITIKELSKGGSGIVYKAYDTVLNRYVAIKFPNMASEASLRRFQREALTIAKLEHPNICPIYDTGLLNNKHFIVMKYIDGETLYSLLWKISTKECIEIFFKVCDAIEHAHKNGVLHLDIKPQNIMISSDNTVYVLDFGIARDSDILQTKSNELLGTPAYMAPEQIKEITTDERTDIYSLGASLYHCLTKQVPIKGETTIEIITKIIENEPLIPSKINPEIDKDLETIVIKCLYKDPKLRYQKIGDLKEDIKQIINDEPIFSKRSTLLYFSKKILKKHRSFFASTILIAVAIMGIMLMLMNKQKNSREQATIHINKGTELLKIASLVKEKEHRKGIHDYLTNCISEYSKAIEIDETYAEAYLKRGRVYYRLGRFDLAISDYNSAIDKMPKLSESYLSRMLANLMNIHHTSLEFIKEAVETAVKTSTNDFESLKKCDPLPSEIQCAEAIIHIFNNDYANAEKSLTSAIDNNPTHTDSIFLRSMIRSTQSNLARKDEQKKPILQNALKDIERYIELDPNFISIYIYGALIKANLGDKDGCDDFILTAKQIGGTNPEVHLQEARINLIFGDKESAVNILKNESIFEIETYKNQEKLCAFYISRGILKLQAGLITEGDQDFDKALSLVPVEVRPKVSRILDRSRKSATRRKQ
ncbi:MAG: protein kinase [Planctomycetes bacterium]|nr:protein kinase [Planctomycetota bacterium]